jgi:hypothetical protein
MGEKWPEKSCKSVITGEISTTCNIISKFTPNPLILRHFQIKPLNRLTCLSEKSTTYVEFSVEQLTPDRLVGLTFR